MNRAVIQHLYDNDVVLGWWSHNVGDWEPMSSHTIIKRATGGMQAGDVILMHDAGTSTAMAIPPIVREAHQRGLRFVPMPGEPVSSNRMDAAAR
jgi:peptidoglycan/xylan/chitin deacetylase (PgdA/CDA1 family)